MPSALNSPLSKAHYISLQALAIVLPPLVFLVCSIPGRRTWYHFSIGLGLLLAGWIPAILHASLFVHDFYRFSNEHETEFFHDKRLRSVSPPALYVGSLSITSIHQMDGSGSEPRRSTEAPPRITFTDTTASDITQNTAATKSDAGSLRSAYSFLGARDGTSPKNGRSTEALPKITFTDTSADVNTPGTAIPKADARSVRSALSTRSIRSGRSVRTVRSARSSRSQSIAHSILSAISVFAKSCAQTMQNASLSLYNPYEHDPRNQAHKKRCKRCSKCNACYKLYVANRTAVDREGSTEQLMRCIFSERRVQHVDARHHPKDCYCILCTESVAVGEARGNMHGKGCICTLCRLPRNRPRLPKPRKVRYYSYTPAYGYGYDTGLAGYPSPVYGATREQIYGPGAWNGSEASV